MPDKEGRYRVAHIVGADAGGLTAPRVERDFVAPGSVVRKIWGDPELVLLVFAGSAAEFALNRAVDWLFFTGGRPNDPLGRLFSTVRYAQEIVFADEDTARRTLGRINAIHSAVERERGQSIPDWAFRDVLYMLIDYSERAHRLLRGPLTAAEREELYADFRRVGEGLNIRELPRGYGAWRGGQAGPPQPRPGLQQTHRPPLRAVPQTLRRMALPAAAASAGDAGARARAPAA